MTKISAKKIREILESKYLTNSIENRLYLKMNLYRFQLKNEISIGEHMNNYTKFLADLANMDEVIKEDDKMLILLRSLSNEKYEIFILTLINDKSSLSYSKVSVDLMNYEVRKKDKESSSSSTTAEALTAKEISFNRRKVNGDFGKSKTDNCKLRKNHCAFCKKEEQ